MRDEGLIPLLEIGGAYDYDCLLPTGSIWTKNSLHQVRNADTTMPIPHIEGFSFIAV